ncbi:MAG TPA: primosomal protein N' [Candidatus Babeliales bacterium]|nr:primosomal protein N' [Candidatus Babeliales bacterium]
MFIRVKLLNGLPEPLWYSVPHNLSNNPLSGLIVQVPVRNRIVPALVLDEYKHKPHHLAFELKDICGLEPLPADEYYHTFLHKLGDYYQVEPVHFIKRIHQFLINKQEPSLTEATTGKFEIYCTKSAVILTDEQQKVCNFIAPHITDSKYCPVVLHGVTGSGKTEVYKNLFLYALHLNKTSLLLLPEVTLAIAFENRLKQELPHLPIFGFHSGKTPKEKKIVWNNLTNQTPMILIGVHLPVLLPIPNLGLMVVDEEHEIGYQEKKHPKINSKEAAIIRAQELKIPILLGSATPSLQTLHNVKTKQWAFFQLKKRFSGTLPTVKVISLTENKNRKQFWISKELEHEIKDRLAKNEQTIIFINRRGFSFFVQCKQCTFIFTCTNCSVSLTLHQDNQSFAKSGGHGHLVCHYCSASQILPANCPSCKTNGDDFLKKGIGTQQVVTLLQKMFPAAVIARADLDTSTKKKVWQQTIADMMSNKIHILVGTQTITKGFHFPHVTLVGVLWADLQLRFPVYNAAETALQQLIQVAGRAGRNHQESTVIIQTMADHELFKFLNEIDYLQFYAAEMEARTELLYPPVFRFAEFELKHVDEKKLEHDANDFINLLHAYAQNNNLPVTILGPAKPPVSKIKSVHSRKIYIKSEQFVYIVRLCKGVVHKKYASAVYFTPNPLA